MGNERAVSTELRKLGVSLEDGEKDVRFLVVKELRKRIPIYSVRNLEHHKFIAKEIASEKPIAVSGGVWAVFKGVKRESEGAEFFRIAKPGRPVESKVPLFLPPEEATHFIDWSKVHRDFRNLEWRWRFARLWQHGAPLHIVAPIRENVTSLPADFKTSPEDFQRRYPGSTPTNCTTASFYWREDPYWRHLTTYTSRVVHTETFLGVSSFNAHGEEPPYTFDELLEHISVGRVPFEVVIRDDLYESYEAFVSHTQIRLPLKGEDPCFTVLRIGSFSPEGFRKATGFEWKFAKGEVRDVRRNRLDDVDAKLLAMTERIKQDFSKENPLVRF